MEQTNFRVKQNIPYTECVLVIVRRVDSPLDKKLAAFLKKKRGEMTFKAFSQRTGLPPSTLFRLEQGAQSITLGKLHLVMTRLKCQLSDIFGND